jgi:hypothetical protein
MKNKYVAGIIVVIGLGCIFAYLYYVANIIKTKEGLESGNQPIPKDSTGNYIPIPDGFYKVSNGVMAPVPYGYVATADKSSIYPISHAALRDAQAQRETAERGFSGGFAGSGSRGVATDICFNRMNYLGATTEASYNRLTHFDSNNYNVQYHDTADNLAASNDFYDVSFGTVWVLDQCGNKIAMPYSPSQGSITYHTPGSYRFGPSSYVPTYEDSVYLSSTAGNIIDVPTHSALTYKNANKGMCDLYDHLPEAREEKCNALSADVCASTSCCVYLGGEKCVSGNIRGPYVKANYSDMFIKNKDFYFYQGKCYGNCPSS